jgi:FRG domain-containing protein
MVRVAKPIELIQAGEALGNACFRGQGAARWGLQSTLERDAERFRVPRQGFLDREQVMFRLFRERAHLYSRSLDAPKSTFEWYALIRHYGGPSRMIDITSSYLVAAYFAVSDSQRNTDAAIWAFCEQTNTSAKPSDLDSLFGPKGAHANSPAGAGDSRRMGQPRGSGSTTSEARDSPGDHHLVEQGAPDPDAPPEQPRTTVEKVPQLRRLQDQREVEEAWSEYLMNHWEPWAEKMRRWQEVHQVYEAVDFMRRRVEESEERYELLLGVGLAGFDWDNGKAPPSDRSRRN